MTPRIFLLFLLISPELLPAQTERPFYDKTFFSEVFDEDRDYRLFLPADYDSGNRRYPVIYYFHGHSDRFTLEHYDDGTDTVPRIAAYVRAHPVIVVTVDGYVDEHYNGFYGGDPWDVRKEGGEYDFGEYFLEVVEHIDGTLRTLTDRRHRATCGLSMGGFMSLYLSARYPDRSGSASAFNPGPEFYVGDPGRRVLWRPKDHIPSHRQSRVRLVRATGDFISQYHEETADAFSRDHAVGFEYRRDEFHKHAATSIEETFDFHRRAFADSALDNVPVEWSYSSPDSAFEVWGYQVEAPGSEKAIVYLDEVRQGGLRITTRRWAPDGPALEGRPITVRTAPIYKRETPYRILDYALDSGETTVHELLSDSAGRLELTVDGAGHQIGISGPGTGSQPPVLLPVGAGERLYVPSGRTVDLPVRLFNPRGVPMEGVEVSLSSNYPTVRIEQGEARAEHIAPGSTVDLTGALQAGFTAGDGSYEKARLHLQLTYDGWHETSQVIDVAILPERIPEPAELEFLDGRTRTFPVFRQAGNRGGGSLLERTVTEGTGNGNGVLEPGEEATIWIRMTQGMDPFDKNSWARCKVRADSDWVTVVADIQEEKQREWTGAMNRSSRIRLAEEVPAGARIPIILENESWSFRYTPDVRYGPEPLYQAIQLHTFHLHRWVLEVE